MGARRASVEAKRDEINQLARRHHARSVSLCGSAARGDDHASPTRAISRWRAVRQ